jgi:hypothetical protein
MSRIRIQIMFPKVGYPAAERHPRERLRIAPTPTALLADGRGWRKGNL